MASGEDQERFEDYLELEQYIEELQAGRVAHLPKDLTPDQARIYHMAALFHAASSEEATPRPQFMADLQAKLEQELQKPAKKHLPFAKRLLLQQVHISRRAMLTGGAAAAVAAASLAVGAGLDHVVEEQKIQNRGATWPPLVPSNVPSVEVLVTTLIELGDSVASFSTGTAVGYVLRDDGSGSYSEQGQIIALSAACTHMGCIVQWNSGDRTFHCPCHGGIYTSNGQIDTQSATIPYFTPLPRYDVRVDDKGNIFVRVPAKPA